MPKHGTPSEFGDLTITFSIDFPKEVDLHPSPNPSPIPNPSPSPSPNPNPNQVDEALASGLDKLLPQFNAADMRVVT